MGKRRAPRVLETARWKRNLITVDPCFLSVPWPHWTYELSHSCVIFPFFEIQASPSPHHNQQNMSSSPSKQKKPSYWGPPCQVHRFTVSGFTSSPSHLPPRGVECGPSCAVSFAPGVNFAARSVISPDPNIEPSELRLSGGRGCSGS